jgi:hypothetical protein
MGALKIKDASKVEELCWAMRLADQPRSVDRALIDTLFNGFPPYTQHQVQQNNIDVNVNFLEPTKLAQDARSQYETAYFTPNQYFQVRVDRGPSHKRDEWSEIITTQLRRAMKDGQSAQVYRRQKYSIFSQLVLHGSGPLVWGDREKWAPTMQAMADVLIPSRTLLTLENLTHFSIYRRYTAADLARKINGPNVDRGWKKEIANSCIRWAVKESGQAIPGDDMTWNQERVVADMKANSLFYASDAVPTINCFDFYYFDEESKDAGWKRKIVLDSPSISEAGATKASVKEAKNILEKRGQYLYDSGRNYAPKLSEIINFQFADGSVVAPNRYDSIRSLGFLLYAVCHLQNRLRCSLTAASFEAAMQYFRVHSPEDVQRAIRINLGNKCVIPDNVQFVGAQERWKVDAQLIQTVMGLNRQSMADNSTAYTRNFGLSENEPREKTATQINAEVNAATAMVGAMLETSYGDAKFEYMEECRRFCIPNSKDPDVRKFRLRCLKDGVPEEILNPECWEISVERVMGSGNRELAQAQAQLIMSQYHLLEPDAQRIALRKFMFAVTNDAGVTELLVPQKPNMVTDSIHDAQMSAATMLLGLPMGLKQGVSHGEYASVLLGTMNVQISKIDGRGGVATAEEITGLMSLAGQDVGGQPLMMGDQPGNGAFFHIQILSQDAGSKEIVKQLGDTLAKLMNSVRAYVQRLEEQQESAQQNGNGQPPIDPASAAKIKGQLLAAEVKAESMREAHSQRSEQRAQIHAQNLSERQADAEMKNAQEVRKTQVDVAAKDLVTQGEIQRMAAKPDKPSAE